MIWILGVIFIIGVVALGMLGGQKNKAARRFGIPGLAFLFALLQGLGWRSCALLLFIPTLAMGYGQNSFLFGFLHHEALVRIAYAFCLAIPFLIFGLVRFMIALPCLIAAFSIHAGSLGKIGGFDFLIEDMIRYGILAVLVFVLMIVWRKK